MTTNDSEHNKVENMLCYERIANFDSLINRLLVYKLVSWL